MPDYANEELREKVKNAPKGPGCYLFYDRRGNLIYVGKSKNLPDRVRSYFGEAAKSDERIAGLVREITDVRFVRAETELDALIEEYTLIKQHRPWFNSQHARDIRPHFLRVRPDVPSVTITRTAQDAGARYLGPFRDIHRARDAVALLNAAWQTPLCEKDAWPTGTRPCLYHGMGRCHAPCADAAGGFPHARALEAFLSGDASPTLSRLRMEMADHASAFRFEAASATRETMAQVEQLARRVERGFHIGESTHALLLMRGFGERVFSVFHIRQGEARCRIQAGEGQASAVPVACLMEISAHKRFIPLAEGADEDAVRDALAALIKAEQEE